MLTTLIKQPTKMPTRKMWGVIGLAAASAAVETAFDVVPYLAAAEVGLDAVAATKGYPSAVDMIDSWLIAGAAIAGGYFRRESVNETAPPA
jgi:hypothetical protein